MKKVYLYVGVGLFLALSALAVVGLGKKVIDLRAEVRAQAEAAERARSAERKAGEALVLLRQKNAATARETAVKHGSLAAAAASAPEWAAAEVPEGVREALR
jgi:hypothetical protein